MHKITERHVAAVDEAPAERDESGKIVRQAREARDAYDVYDVTVHCEPHGGYALVLLRADSVEHLGGVIPSKGDAVDWPVRNYVSWQGRPGNKYAVVGHSVAAEELQAEYEEKTKSSTGSRPVASVAG